MNDKNFEAKSLGEILASNPEFPDETVRYPVANREDRELMGGQKFHLIKDRDGGACWLCGRSATRPVLDHLKPRSSFSADEMTLADRSDNLHIACWDCNDERSNFHVSGMPTPIGATAACWDCLNAQNPELYWEVEPPVTTVPAYCGKCGHTWVPDTTWLL